MASSLDEYYKRFMQNYGRHGAVFTFVLCGIAGALVDIDHIPKLLYLIMCGLRRMKGRSLHPVFFLLACCVCIYFGVLLYRAFSIHRAKMENATQIKN